MSASKSMDDVIKHYDHVLTDEERIIFRTEILGIDLRTFSIRLYFINVIMITRNCIEWYSCAHNALFPSVHKMVLVKADIT